MMRILMATAAFFVALAFDVPASQAYSGSAPWCALINVGTGAMYEDCQYASLEACRPNVLAGNRGFCNPNPRWEGSAGPAEPRRHRKRHAHRH